MSKITKAQLDEICKINKSNNIKIHFILESGEINIEFKPYLSLTDESFLIDSVVDSSFNKDNDYIPEYQELMFFTRIIQLMTDIPLPEINVYEDAKSKKVKSKILDLKKIKDVMNQTNIMNKINNLSYSDNVNEKEFYEYIRNLQIKVNDKVKFRQNQIVADKRNYSEIEELIKTVLNKTSNMIDKLDLPTVIKVIEKINKTGIPNKEDIVKTFIDEVVKKDETKVETKETATTINE